MEKLSVSCVIPAFNEEKTVAGVIDCLKDLKEKAVIAEIIVVSDGSTDQTAEKAREAGADIVIELEKNIGKGGAVLEGIKKSTQEILLFLDADLINLKSEHVLQIIELVLKNQADMAVGFLADMQSQTLLQYFSGQRALRRSMIENVARDKKFLKSRFQFETFLNRLARKQKLKTIFIPLYGLLHVKKESKYAAKEAVKMRAGHLADMFLRAYRKYVLISLTGIIGIFIFIIFFSPMRITGMNFGSLPGPAASDKILVIAAHPDDEVIGAGGFLADAVKAGAQARVVIVTNGDGSKFDAELIDKKILVKPKDLIQEGKTRIKESRAALALSGIPENKIFFLSFPDKELSPLLSKYWEKPETSKYTGFNQTVYEESYKQNISYAGKSLLETLEEIISSTTPTIIITHNLKDTNADHAAVYKFVKLATDQLGERGLIARPKMYYFLVHWQTFEFPRPFKLNLASPLFPPRKLKNICDWVLYPLSKETENLKLEEIKTYKSQLKNPYLHQLLEAFARTNELFCENMK